MESGIVPYVLGVGSEFLCVSCSKRLAPAAAGRHCPVNTPATDSISHNTLLRSDFLDNVEGVRSLRRADRRRDVMDWSGSSGRQQPDRRAATRSYRDERLSETDCLVSTGSQAQSLHTQVLY